MVSGKSHSAKNLKESLTLAKRFVSCRNWGGASRRDKFLKSRIEKTLVFQKTKSDIACWAWGNLILWRKLFLLKNLSMPKTVKGVEHLWFFSIHSVAKFQKIERTLWRLWKIFEKKWEFSLIVPRNMKGTFSDILTFVLLQNIKQIEWRTLGDIKKLSKKCLKAEKRGKISVPKSENLLLRNTCKK